MPKLNLKTFTVRGKGSFPVDMLRYDKCWPATMDDAEVMAEVIAQPVVGKVDIKLTTCIQPTPERWRLFGWYVL
jgi:hypothetical protein